MTKNNRGVKKFLLNFLTPQTTLVLTAESRHFATAFTRIQTRSRAKPTKIAVKCRIPDRHFTGAVRNIEFFTAPEHVLGGKTSPLGKFTDANSVFCADADRS